MSNVIKNLPSASELLDSPPLKSLISRVNRNVVVSGVRRFLDDLRGQVQGAAAGISIPLPGELAERIAAWIARDQQPALRPIINATGVLLPAQLGGPPLAEEAILAAHHLAQGYAHTGGNAAADAEQRLTTLTGAEAALVTGNHAAATVLALAVLAAGREVVVARSELAELDDGTRSADLVAAASAVLCEVGAANKTRATDYAAAICPRSAVILRIHCSQWAVVGSSEQTPLAELASLARKHQLPLIHDLGAGGLVDLTRFGIAGEPLASASIQAGCDLTLLRGDQLLGGPRCGILVGKRSLIQKLRQHALFSALQANPLVLASLSQTLRLCEDSQHAERSIPLLSLLTTPPENLRNRAERISPQLAATGVVTATVVECQAQLSSSSLAGHKLSSYAIAVQPVRGNLASLDAALQAGTPAVCGRLEGDRLLLDLRAVLPRQDVEVVAAFEALAPSAPEPPLPEDKVA